MERLGWQLCDTIEKYSFYLSRVLSKSKLMEWFLIWSLCYSTNALRIIVLLPHVVPTWSCIINSYGFTLLTNLTIREGFKKKRWKNFHLWFWTPPPSLRWKSGKKNFISRSDGVFTHNWYQRWKIKKKKIPGTPPNGNF